MEKHQGLLILWTTHHVVHEWPPAYRHLDSADKSLPDALDRMWIALLNSTVQLRADLVAKESRHAGH